MPEKEGFSRLKLVRTGDMPPAPKVPAAYVELGVSSPFSFLRGASDAIELVLRALELGMDAIGIADRNTLAGVVRMHSAAREAGLKPLIGCRLVLTDAPSLLAYPIDREGYGRLSRLLSLGKMRAEKGECELTLQDVAEHREGIAFIAWPDADLDAFGAELTDRFGPLPEAVQHLLRIVAIKALCRRANVEKVDTGPKGAVLAFRNNEFANPDGLVAYIRDQSPAARVRPDMRVVFFDDWERPEQRLKGTTLILRRLVSIAEQKKAA